MSWDVFAISKPKQYSVRWTGKGLVKHLGVFEMSPTAAESVIVDEQLFYLVATRRKSLKSDRIHDRPAHQADDTEKVIVFDNYQDVSAKDH